MAHPLPARSRPFRAAGFLGVALLVLAASQAPARASVFYDATLGLGLGDDARIFVNVTNDYFAPPPAIGVDLIRRCPSPEDDYPVILLLARACRRPPMDILRLRLDYLSWSDIMFRLNIPPTILFVGLDRDPGPPYGRAWGYWRKHPRGEPFRFRDHDVAELAKLQVAAGYHHVSPYSVIDEGRRGVTVERFVAEKNRGRYERGGGVRARPRGDDEGRQDGRGQDKRKDRGKPKSHGNPHDHD